MDRFLARALRLLALQLVVLTAVIHLSWGLPRAFVYLDPAALELYLTTSALPDPRPVLFVLSGGAIVVGTLATWRGYLSLSRAYKLGIVMMGIYVVGWTLWHTTGHGQLFFGEAVSSTAGGEGHSHGGILHTIVDHIVTLPLEAASKSAEIGAATLFALLLRGDPDLAEDERWPW